MLIVKLICMVLGTVLAVLFILFTLRGRKEDWRIEGVPQKEFSDKALPCRSCRCFPWIRLSAKK